jgi:hypothetical protein
VCVLHRSETGSETQPSIEWVAVGLTWGMERPERAVDMPGLRMCGAEPPHSCMCSYPYGHLLCKTSTFTCISFNIAVFKP